MKSFIDQWGGDVPDKTIHAISDEPWCMVKYPKPDGGYFRVIVRQKPNPIGFHARLPGDKRNSKR